MNKVSELPESEKDRLAKQTALKIAEIMKLHNLNYETVNPKIRLLLIDIFIAGFQFSHEELKKIC